MTTAERSARRWAKRDEEIRLLRRALLEGLPTTDDAYRQRHANLIARANAARLNKETP